MLLPTLILPGFFASASEYRALELSLNQRGIPTSTVPLRKRSWLPTLGGRSMVPILHSLDRSVKQALQQYSTDRVNLIGHSAGGWIARIYLGELPYDIHGDRGALWNARDRVATLVTLGTPHLSQERWTKRNLDFVKNFYPGAFYPEVKYVCVAGKAIYGSPQTHWFAYNSYKLTCGEGNCWGDGITPVIAAHLDGAENLTLEGVMHSPRGRRRWYGSPEVRETWVRYLN
ncbi:MAG: alpha/beta fold hydrolase [Cyanobacteriota bacterium]|nr:alpha/beta fold hydrolase [Cyanobacteriota bacterium]